MDDLISKLSEIRSDYNCFDEDEEPYYRALSETIRILSQRADGDTISRQAALDAIMGQPPEPHYPSWYAAQIEKLPSAQPDHVADISKKVEGDCISRQMAIDAMKDALDPHIVQFVKSKMAIEALPSVQPDHNADSDKKVSISCGQENDLISRQAAIDALARMMPRSYTPDGSHPADEEIFRAQEVFADCIEALEILPSAQPDRKLIADYMWKIKQNISPHTAAEGVIAIKYYLEQIYEQIYGEGEKPKWMT